jgi:hypothetical protein
VEKVAWQVQENYYTTALIVGIAKNIRRQSGANSIENKPWACYNKHKKLFPTGHSSWE